MFLQFFNEIVILLYLNLYVKPEIDNLYRIISIKKLTKFIQIHRIITEIDNLYEISKFFSVNSLKKLTKVQRSIQSLRE